MNDVTTEAKADIEDAANLFMALAKEKQANAEAVVYVDDDGNDVAVTVYDHREYVWKTGDTMDSLAAKYLTTPDYAQLICFYNRIQDEGAIKPGTRIKIPVLAENAGNLDNRIYTAPELQDSYGTDIMINDDGDFACLGGDLKGISGSANLAQALALRLTTASGRRLRIGAYGIRAATGDPMAIESYLTSAVEQTVKEDPRIETVDEISFAGAGDSLSLDVTYTDINGNSDRYRGIL